MCDSVIISRLKVVGKDLGIIYGDELVKWKYIQEIIDEFEGEA